MGMSNNQMNHQTMNRTMNQNAIQAKKSLINTINTASFAMDDARLFLDTHPYCEEALAYYEKMRQIRKEGYHEYTKHFGPLMSQDVKPENMWMWNQGPMPWEREGC